jgi:membrane-associated PAP2 superfamily phosphatase
MLGLSTQVPAVWLYISDGPYKTYKADGMTLKFKHTDNKNEIINISYKTALIVQALKALGKNNITNRELRSISKLLTENEKAQILIEAKRVTAWVYELIRKICKEDV